MMKFALRCYFLPIFLHPFVLQNFIEKVSLAQPALVVTGRQMNPRSPSNPNVAAVGLTTAVVHQEAGAF